MKSFKNNITPQDPVPVLPVDCQLLAGKCPLYVAIVLEQGTYPWKNEFLKQFDSAGHISAALEDKVCDIKPSVKQALLQDWESHLSFEAYLEGAHG